MLVTAPPKQDVALLAEADVARSKIQMQCWYVLWGLVPITNNSTADIIAKHNLKNVKVKTYFSPIDFLINIVLGSFTIYTNTVEIEGNVAE